MKTLATPILSIMLATDSCSLLAQEQESPARASISREASRAVTVTQGGDTRFTGTARITSLFTANTPSRVTGGQVTFEPGARTAWHTHPVGQTLIVTAGTGRIQFWGGVIQEIRTGDVVSIPPATKHWHGASPGTSMTHIAIQEQVKGKTAEWFEKVTDEQYGITASATPTPDKNSRAQQLFGEIAPKFAELTDNVLYADVWERPELSKRDRSLVTVSALIALNRPDQLRSHLELASKNGLTREELVETITHLAFYSGWPSSVSAATIAKEVLQPK
ncbi:MAG: carboxymuconolactone decarboxylase family protein [Candidatus Competibacteraceae bacterium]|nr:carboxymuconolactone decarboxylase family protein [Candidatus Competibacteraceae bacterium]